MKKLSDMQTVALELVEHPERNKNWARLCARFKKRYGIDIFRVWQKIPETIKDPQVSTWVIVEWRATVRNKETFKSVTAIRGDEVVRCNLPHNAPIEKFLEYYPQPEPSQKRPKTCYCDNTHEQNGTCCISCWDAGFRTVNPGDQAAGAKGRYSPGPFALEDQGGNIVIVDADGVPIGEVWGAPGGKDDRALMAANAFLLQAAPDMLAALRGLLRLHYDEGKPSADGLECVHMAEAAIAKTKGTI